MRLLLHPWARSTPRTVLRSYATLTANFCNTLPSQFASHTSKISLDDCWTNEHMGQYKQLRKQAIEARKQIKKIRRVVVRWLDHLRELNTRVTFFFPLRLGLMLPFVLKIMILFGCRYMKQHSLKVDLQALILRVKLQPMQISCPMVPV